MVDQAELARREEQSAPSGLELIRRQEEDLAEKRRLREAQEERELPAAQVGDAAVGLEQQTVADAATQSQDIQQSG